MSDMTRRSMLLGSLNVAAIGVLSACGSNDSPSTSASSSSGKSSSAAGATGSILVWTDSNREPVLRKVAEQFKSDTGVTVKLAVKDFAKIPDDFITQAPTGKGPDAAIAAHDATGRMVQNGVIAPLELGEISAYQDVAIQAFTVNGKIYGGPYATENIALVRNTTFVKDAPKTFDDMIEMGKKSGAKYPFLVGLDPKQSDPYHLYPFQASFGAPVFELKDKGFDSSKVAMLEQLLEREREALAREREVSADLKEDRDRWRAQATGLLSDLRTAQEKAVPAASPEALPGPQPKGFWKRLFG